MSETQALQRYSAKDLKLALDKPAYKDRFVQLMGQRAPQFCATLNQIVTRSYYLSKCSPESIIGAAINAVSLDLSIDPNLGEAHLVPYGDQCQFQVGYLGFNQLAMRSGQYKTLGWMVVREGQLKKWNPLTGELVVDPTAKTSETIIGYAAMFTLLNGFERGSYWTVAEVKAHAERYSQAYKKQKKDSPWFTNFDKMALKTVLKELLKTWGPKSIQMQKAILEDQSVRKSPDADPEFPDNEVIDVEASAPKFEKKPAPSLFTEKKGGDKKGAGKPDTNPTPPTPPTGDKLATLRKLIADSGKTEEQTLNAMRESGMVDETLDSLEVILEFAPSAIDAAITNWAGLKEAIDANSAA